MGMSNVETILEQGIAGEPITVVPQSRVETLLIQLIDQGGGGGGTTVVANPSGPATDDLEKLQVGSTVYAVNGGGNTFSLDGERLIIS